VPSNSTLFNFGISRADFFAHHFEKAPYLARTAISQEVISLVDMERLIASWDPTDPRLRIFRNGLVPPSEYIGLIDDVDGPRAHLIPDKFQSLLSTSATLVLDRIDAKLPMARQLCKQLGEFTQEATAANAYLAFGGCGIFGKHWDTHDVVAIQLLGAQTMAGISTDTSPSSSRPNKQEPQGGLPRGTAV
jgi:ribosomal protein L16 Arg81 hydroxylase